VAVNGQPAKFCGECGEPLGGAIRSTARESIKVEATDFEDISSENMFAVYADGTQKMSFESVHKSERGSVSGRGKGNASLESIRANAKRNIQIDA